MKKILLLLFMLINSIYAKTHEGSFEKHILRDKSGNSFEFTLKVKYRINTLMKEPVINAVAKYEIGEYIDIDGSSYVVRSFPDEVINKLRIYGMDIEASFVTSSHRNLWIEIDEGVMSSPEKWGFNTPESPSWNKWIYYDNLENNYLSKSEAISAYKDFLGLGSAQSDNGTFDILTKVYDIRYDISAAKSYLKEKVIEQKKKELNKSNKIKELEYQKQQEIKEFEKELEKGKKEIAQNDFEGIPDIFQDNPEYTDESLISDNRDEITQKYDSLKKEYINSKLYSEYSKLEMIEEEYDRVTGILENKKDNIIYKKQKHDDKFEKLGKITKRETDKTYDFYNYNNNYMFSLDYNKYYDVGDFKGNFCKVCIDSSGCGYINRLGKISIDAIYSKVGDFINNIALVKKDKKIFFIDINGNAIGDKIEISYTFEYKREGDDFLILKDTYKNGYYDCDEGYQINEYKYKKYDKFGNFLDSGITTIKEDYTCSNFSLHLNVEKVK